MSSSQQVPARFTGGCACGAVRYRCDAPAEAMVNCHCRDCQRAGGTSHSPSVIVESRSFRIEAGQPVYHESVSDAGNVARRAFCGTCGSPLFASSSARPERIAVRAGSLDDPGWFHATADVWTDSAQPWALMASDTDKYGRAR